MAAAAASLIALAAPAASSAAGYGCDASALRVTMLGKAVEPVTANRGAPSCANDSKSLSGTGLSALSGPLGLAVLPVNAQAIAASTQISGTSPGPTQKALAMGGVANLAIPLATLPSLITLPTVALPATPPLTVDLTPVKTALAGNVALALLSAQINQIPNSATVDLTSALQALLPAGGKLPTGDLLDVAGAVAYAGGVCSSGKPTVAGTSQVAGIKVLGQAVTLGTGYNQSLNLIDSANIDPSNAAVAIGALGLPSTATTAIGMLDAVGGVNAATNAINAAIRSALDALPNINVLPATAAQVTLTPGSSTTVGDKVTQQALNVTVSVLGQKLIDGVVGEATASKGTVDCVAPAPPPAQTAASATLQCTTRHLVLTDVAEHGSRVKLQGVADVGYIGKTVDIVFEHTGGVVAKAKVAKDGTFASTAPMPSASVAGTNAARYVAKLGKQKSLDLKLRRRMTVSSETSKHGQVTIAGRVTRPLGSPVQTITLTRRVSCSKSEVVKRFKPKADGTFRVTVANPKNANGVGVYRMGTKVRKTTKNPKLFPTFTLPKAVNLS